MLCCGATLAAASTGPVGGLNSTTNAGSLNRCDTNSYSSLYPKEEQNSFFGSFHQKIMDGVEFSTKMLWTTRLNSAVRPALSATNVAIDNTNPYFQSIAGETTQNVSFDFSPFLGGNNVTDYNNTQMFQITPQLVVDLPFGSYEESPAQGFRTASRVMAETGCAAVKLEGGKAMAETIAFLTARVGKRVRPGLDVARGGL